jgi:heme iron utilization protein
MFIAMNRFQVRKGAETAFETVWATRKSYLGNMPGFVELRLLKGPEAEDHTLYSSHTSWVDKAAFEAWTRSRRCMKVSEMLSTDLTDLGAYMADNPGAVIEEVARERKVTPRTVIEALPSSMLSMAGGDRFEFAMRDIAQWGEVTLIVHTEDGIFEFTGAIPDGDVGGDYFNLIQPKGLHGHLRHTRSAAMAFVERPFMGKTSAFVTFINVDGGIMFKVFVGRDEARALRTDQLARFRHLAERIGASAVP